jgi:hypothetical protein
VKVSDIRTRKSPALARVLDDVAITVPPCADASRSV